MTELFFKLISKYRIFFQNTINQVLKPNEDKNLGNYSGSFVGVRTLRDEL